MMKLENLIAREKSSHCRLCLHLEVVVVLLLILFRLIKLTVKYTFFFRSVTRLINFDIFGESETCLVLSLGHCKVYPTTPNGIDHH